MNNTICRIYNNKIEGIGFFTKIPFKSKLLPVLMTNNHIINPNDINNSRNKIVHKCNVCGKEYDSIIQQVKNVVNNYLLSS